MSVLITQSFGKEIEYRRALFAIWSYWTYRPLSSVILFTDNPAYFQTPCSGKPIQFVLLTDEKIRKMRGSIDFLHRMKIALLEESFQLTNENILYVDSDVYFLRDVTPLLETISPNIAYMHKREYQFGHLSKMELPAAKPFHAFLALIENNVFKGQSGQTIKVTPQHYSWNAGVIMLHQQHKNLLNDVYALTDQFFPPTGNQASEQYAFSMVLQNNVELRPCDSEIYHYFPQVSKQVVDTFLESRINTEWMSLPASAKSAEVELWISELQNYIQCHVLTLRDNAIQAFHEDRFGAGYSFAFRAFIKQPTNVQFVRDVLYHVRRHIYGKRS